jgi:hypothetical protein
LYQAVVHTKAIATSHESKTEEKPEKERCFPAAFDIMGTFDITDK